MQEQLDDIQVNYFLICDQVITDAATNKQSLIGIYSALTAEKLPLYTNVAVALCLRVHSARERRLRLRFSDPDGQVLFDTILPCDWEPVMQGLQHSTFATLQMGINLQSLPLARPGVYMAALYTDDVPAATYLLSVMMQQPQSQSNLIN
jgi:hypothetical protein